MSNGETFRFKFDGFYRNLLKEVWNCQRCFFFFFFYFSVFLKALYFVMRSANISRF